MRNPGKSAIAVAACVAALAAGASPAPSRELKGSGTVTYMVTQIARIPLPGGKVLTESHYKGVVLAADAADPFNLSSQDCSGAEVDSSDRTLSEEIGTCVAFDKAGDVWWLQYTNKGDDRRWSVVSGIGKYAGMTGSGTTKLLTATADGRATISWSGTVNLK